MPWAKKQQCPICRREMMLYDKAFKPKMKKDEKYAGEPYYKCGSCQKFFTFVDDGVYIWDITDGWNVFQEKFVFR